MMGLRTLGFEEVEDVHTSKVYVIKGDYTGEEVDDMCRRLLANPVSQEYEIRKLEG